MDSFHSCPIPEVARLGRSLRSWRAQILAYFDTHGVNNGGTEAINLIIEKIRRLAHGHKDFDHYRLRILLTADGSRPYRTAPKPPLNPKSPKSRDGQVESRSICDHLLVSPVDSRAAFSISNSYLRNDCSRA